MKTDMPPLPPAIPVLPKGFIAFTTCDDVLAIKNVRNIDSVFTIITDDGDVMVKITGTYRSADFYTRETITEILTKMAHAAN